MNIVHRRDVAAAVAFCNPDKSTLEKFFVTFDSCVLPRGAQDLLATAVSSSVFCFVVFVIETSEYFWSTEPRFRTSLSNFVHLNTMLTTVALGYDTLRG